MLVILTFLINSIFNFALGLLLAHFLGPSEFGRYAIAAAIAVVLNTLFLDWLRLSATRFYSERSRREAPEVRATLDVAFGLSSLGIAVIAGGAMLAGQDFDLPLALACMAPVAGICNGVFDYHTALLRARFEERAYSRLVILRNALSLGLVIGGATLLQSATVALAGLCLSVFSSLLLTRRALADHSVSWRLASLPQVSIFLVYALPIVLANTVYQVLPLWNRANIAAVHGFAATGQFSLAYDIGSRAVATVGSAMDILLFQIALRAADRSGLDEARRRVELNVGIVLVTLAGLCGGCWLLLPSFEATFVPAAYRGSFAILLLALLPGFFCLALTQYAAASAFQLRRVTWPLTLSSLVAAGLYGGGVALAGPAPAVETFAHLQSLAFSGALVASVIMVLVVMPIRPRLRDIAAALAVVPAMALAVLPFDSLAPSPLRLLVEGMAAGAAFAMVLLLLDGGGLRQTLVRRFRPRIAPPEPASRA